MEQELWKTGEVLKELKISPPTLKRWRKKPGFPKPTRLGGHSEKSPAWYVAAEIREWKAAHIAAR